MRGEKKKEIEDLQNKELQKKLAEIIWNTSREERRVLATGLNSLVV